MRTRRTVRAAGTIRAPGANASRALPTRGTGTAGRTRIPGRTGLIIRALTGRTVGPASTVVAITVRATRPIGTAGRTGRARGPAGAGI